MPIVKYEPTHLVLMDLSEIYIKSKASKFDYVYVLCFCVQGFLHVLVLSDILFLMLTNFSQT